MQKLRAFAGRIGRAVFWEHGGLTVILGASLVVRLWLLRWWDTFPFGDVFNFVRIAQELAVFNYPIDEKRLPFYPLLILIGHTVFPGVRWETVAIGLAIGMSLLALALLYAIGRTLRLGKVSALVSVLLLSAFPPFLSYSIRGYADTTLVALFLGTILTALRARTLRGAALFGFFLGAASLTRYEGVAAAGVLLPLFALRVRRVRPIAAALVVLVLTLLPYVAVARSSGRSLLPTTYLEETASAAGSYGAGSVAELWDRYETLWRRLGLFQLWRTPAELFRNAREDFLGLHRPLADLFREPGSVTALLAIPGFCFLAWRRRGDLLLMTLPFFAMAVPIAWYALYPRYTAFLFPMMTLAAGVGVHAGAAMLRRGTTGAQGRVLRRGLAVGTLFVAAAIWFLGFTQQAHESLKKSRFRERAYYDAVRRVESLPGTIAFEERRGITETYFGARAVYGTELFDDKASREERWSALLRHGVATVLVQPSKRSVFQFLDLPPRDVALETVVEFTIEQGNHDLDVARIVVIGPGQ